MSNSKICPVDVPTPNCKPPLNFNAVTEGNPSKLIKNKLNLQKIMEILISTYLLYSERHVKAQSNLPTHDLVLGSQASTVPSCVPQTNKL